VRQPPEVHPRRCGKAVELPDLSGAILSRDQCIVYFEFLYKSFFVSLTSDNGSKWAFRNAVLKLAETIEHIFRNYQAGGVIFRQDFTTFLLRYANLIDFF
jgi:hypothetical protein